MSEETTEATGDLTEELIEDIVGNWGEDYLPIEENPATDEIEIPKPKSKGEEKAEKEETQAVSDEESNEEEQPEKVEAKEEEQPEKVEAKEEEEEEGKSKKKNDPETERRLALLEKREILFRQREAKIKAGLEEKLDKLEKLQAAIDGERRKHLESIEREKEVYKRNPAKFLEMASQRYGLEFPSLAVANLRRSGIEVPPELESQVPKYDPMEGLEDRLARLVQQAVTPIQEKLEAQEHASIEAARQQYEAAVEDNRGRAVGFVTSNADNYPYLAAAFEDDPDELATQMIAVRDEIYRTTGNYGKISDAAAYIENKLSSRFHRIASHRSNTTPKQNSGKQSPRERTSTLSNEAGAQRVSRTPRTMEEEYEYAWENAPSFLRGS